MEYNASRNQLVIKEYGRNIQKMIEYTVTVDDDVKRNQLVQGIIDLMGQLNPHLKNVDDFKHKLWDHLHIISNFKLEIESPFPAPDIKQLQRKPEHIGYPKKDVKFMHYGKNVESMVNRAKTFTDEQKKKAFAECIGSYMKMVYKNWNKEYVGDELIIRDLKILSNAELELADGANLDILAKSTRKKRKGNHPGNRRRGGPKGNR